MNRIAPCTGNIIPASIVAMTALLMVSSFSQAQSWKEWDTEDNLSKSDVVFVGTVKDAKDSVVKDRTVARVQVDDLLANRSILPDKGAEQVCVSAGKSSKSGKLLVAGKKCVFFLKGRKCRWSWQICEFRPIHDDHGIVEVSEKYLAEAQNFTWANVTCLGCLATSLKDGFDDIRKGLGGGKGADEKPKAKCSFCGRPIAAGTSRCITCAFAKNVCNVCGEANKATSRRPDPNTPHLVAPEMERAAIGVEMSPEVLVLAPTDTKLKLKTGQSALLQGVDPDGNTPGLGFADVEGDGVEIVSVLDAAGNAQGTGVTARKAGTFKLMIYGRPDVKSPFSLARVVELEIVEDKPEKK